MLYITYYLLLSQLRMLTSILCADFRLNEAAAESGGKRDEEELRQQVSDLKAEVLQWRERGDQKDEEYKVSERDMRKRVIDSEKKAHQTWVSTYYLE